MKLKDDKKYRTIINALAERELPNYALAFKKKGAELTNGKTIDEMLIELDLKHGLPEHR